MEDNGRPPLAGQGRAWDAQPCPRKPSRADDRAVPNSQPSGIGARLPKVLRRPAVEVVTLVCSRDISIGRRGPRSLALWVAMGLSACSSAPIASEVPAHGECVPVLCPVGEVEVEGKVVAARMAGEDLELLVDDWRHAWVVGVAGQRHRIDLPNGNPIRKDNGAVSIHVGHHWSVDKGAATEDGFVLFLQGDNPRSPTHTSPPPNPTSFGLWRVVNGEVAWRQGFMGSQSWSSGINGCLAVSGEEVAVAYLTDDGDGFDQSYTVERWSLANGELLSSDYFDDANAWSSAALRYTPEALLFAWAPQNRFVRDIMYVSAVGGSPVGVRRSRRYGEVALTPSGALAVERAAEVGGRLLLDGDPVLRLGQRLVFLTDMSAIETDKGTAIAFEVAGVRDHDRKGYSGIVGDSGVAMAFEHEQRHPRPGAPREIFPLDAGRMLLVEGEVQRSLSVLTCAGSRPAAGRVCETPEELRLRGGRDVVAR